MHLSIFSPCGQSLVSTGMTKLEQAKGRNSTARSAYGRLCIITLTPVNSANTCAATPRRGSMLFKEGATSELRQVDERTRRGRGALLPRRYQGLCARSPIYTRQALLLLDIPCEKNTPAVIHSRTVQTQRASRPIGKTFTN